MNGPSWLEMDRTDFDADEPLTLFPIPDQSNTARPPDRSGTPDLFTEE